MIVCHCRVVNDDQIARAVAAGARTVADVGRVTGAGSGCGSCVFALKRLISQQDQPRSADLMEEKRAAS